MAGFIFCIIVRRDPCLICFDLDCDVRDKNYSDHYISVQEKPKYIPQEYWDDLNKHKPGFDNKDEYMKPLKQSKRSVSMCVALTSALIDVT